MLGVYFTKIDLDDLRFFYLRNTIFASFILSLTTLFCGRRHALIILVLFFATSLPMYILNGFGHFLEFGLLVTIIFISFTVIMYFFSSKLQVAIVKIEEDKVLISDKNHELGKLLGQIQTEAEITKEKNKTITRKNAQLLVKEHKLKEAISTKDRFFSIIAHDLKGPLSAATSLADFTQSRYNELDDDRRLKYTRAIYDSTFEVSSLLNNLLNWSRSQLNVIDIRKEKIDLDTVIQDEIKHQQQAANQKSIQITLNNELKQKVLTDVQMTGTVPRNLLSNALKFSHQNSRVDIYIVKEADYAKVRIKDSGIGIPKDHVNNMFDLDHKLKRPGTSGEPSTGLGLVLCKEFIEKQGGIIGVESEEDEGSIFYFTLPLA